MTSTTGFFYQSDGLAHIRKDPTSRLPYSWDWTGWLAKAGGGVIVSASIVADPGVVLIGIADFTTNTGKVTQVVSGGVPGMSYKLVCGITTDSGLYEERTIVLDVRDR
jgi:hypothetical protein